MSDKKKSVYSNIADDILLKIRNGTYAIGSLLPPERELMSVYSVQRTTVRRGLDLLASQGYIKKAAGLGSIVQSATPINVSETKVSALYINEAQEKPMGISLLLPANGADGIDRLPSLVIDLIASLNKSCPSFMTSDLSQIDASDSIIALDTNPDTSCRLCLALCQSDDRRSVILDNDKGAYIALSYLEELGHTKIAFIGTENGLSFENAALDSFNAVNSYPDSELINLSGSDEKSGFDGFSELFRRHGRKFTAVCTVNDAVAKGVMKAAKYYKINVPEELSVISLCSSNSKSDIDSVFYDTNFLADEIFDSVKAASRISTVLFGGTLSVKGTSASTNQGTQNGKNMSDFLL